MSGLFGSSKPKEMTPSASPSVTTEPTPTADTSPEALRRAGRASILLSTSSQGLLGKPQTGRQQLLAA